MKKITGKKLTTKLLIAFIVFMITILYIFRLSTENESKYNTDMLILLQLAFLVQLILLVILFFKYRRLKSHLSNLTVSEKNYKAEQNNLEFSSYHDQLTGLYNRRYFDFFVQQLDHSQYLPVSIIMCDLNTLKVTNDAFGHKAGDQLIIEAARLLENTSRTEDVLSRWGGDEFIMILPNTSNDICASIVDRLKSTCETKQSIHGIPLSFSVGYATKESKQSYLEETINIAETFMYHEKTKHCIEYKTALINHITDNILSLLPYQKKHLDDVELLMTHMAKALKYEQSQIEHIQMLARYHDIGLISVKADILGKLEPLTPEEFELIKKQSEVGFRIISCHPYYSKIAHEVLAHHENYDGSGYPKGLSYDEIPIYSRILRICDSFEVMINGRDYKKAVSYTNALNEIKINSGKKYDPELVNVFASLADNKSFKTDFLNRLDNH